MINHKTASFISTKVLLSISVILLAGVVGFANRPRSNPPVAQSCYQTLAELNTVSSIGNATHKLPGDAEMGSLTTKYSVNPELCRAK